MQGTAVLVTGASGALGPFVCQAFLAAGARVFGVSRSGARVLDHPAFTPLAVDLQSSASALEMVTQVVAAAGRLDVLAHLVGGFAPGATAETTDDVFERMIDLNLRSAFYTIRAVLPQMQRRRSGRIIAVGSRAATEPAAGAAAYSASKAALIALIRAVAAENATFGITANVVLPATLDTPANRQVMPDADRRLWVKPEQVARVILWLAGEHTGINGAWLPVFTRTE